MVTSLMLLGSALVGLQFVDAGPRTKIPLTLAAICVVLFFAVSIVSDHLTGAGFNESVIYHLQTGLEGAAIRDFHGLIWSGAGILTISLGVVIGLIWLTPRYLRTKARLRIPAYAPVAMALLAVAVHEVPRKLVEMRRISTDSEVHISQFKAPEPLAPVPKPVNFVWIYGESLERTYLDETLFPGLTPGLKSLDAESLSFTDIRQYPGTEWTVAGMVASQCGSPLPTVGGPGGSLGAYPVFLPGAVCLGDLLSQAGYQLSYIGGADLHFAGKGKFYRSHGFRDVRGLKELEPVVADNSRNSWGIYDDQLFDIVFQQYQSLRKSSGPFGLVTLTTGTHHPVGNIPARCGDLKYQDGSNPMLNAVHCSDRLITELVRKIRADDPNTMIVIASDHLAMPNGAYDKLEKGTRRDLFMVNWPSHIKPALSTRTAGTFSTGVTVLNLMGYDITKLGLGRSLLRAKPTLAEKHKDFSSLVSSWLPQLTALWQLPQSVDAITIDPQRVTLAIGRQTFPLPVAINLDERGGIKRMAFDNPEVTVDQVVEPLKDEGLIWVDACKNMYPKLGRAVEISEGWCLWRGRTREIGSVDRVRSVSIRM